jgi:hypothetical protein
MKNYNAIAAGLLAAAVMLGASPAMARVDVDVNVGIPGIFAPPAPVVVQPAPVVVQPAPVYVRPQPVYVEREDDWKCNKNKCKFKKHKHHKHDD